MHFLIWLLTNLSKSNRSLIFDCRICPKSIRGLTYWSVSSATTTGWSRGSVTLCSSTNQRRNQEEEESMPAWTPPTGSTIHCLAANWSRRWRTEPTECRLACLQLLEQYKMNRFGEAGRAVLRLRVNEWCREKDTVVYSVSLRTTVSTGLPEEKCETFQLI